MIWYTCLFKNGPQIVVIHTVKGCGIVNKTKVDVFLELACFFNDPVDVGNSDEVLGTPGVLCQERFLGQTQDQQQTKSTHHGC